MTNLGFIRMAANDGVHGQDDITTNELTEMKMNKRIARRVKVAFGIVKRDPIRALEFITDVIILVGVFALIIIAVKTAKCVGVV